MNRTDVDQREESIAKRRNFQPVAADSDGDASDDDVEIPAGALDDQMREMTAAIYSQNQDAQLDATMRFRKLLSKEKNPPIDAVIRADVVPRFVEFLESDNSMIQFEAAWALTSMFILPDQMRRNDGDRPGRVGRKVEIP